MTDSVSEEAGLMVSDRHLELQSLDVVSDEYLRFLQQGLRPVIHSYTLREASRNVSGATP